MDIIPTDPTEYKVMRLREELQALENFLYSLPKTSQQIDALFHFGYIQAELLAIIASYEKQAQG